MKEDIDSTALPEPGAVIGGVGSEIRRYPEAELDQAWIDRISDQWDADNARATLETERKLERQPEDCQSDFKVSYYYRNATSQQLDRLRAKLFDAGVNVSLIYSSNRDLDILPEGVNKGTAAKFIARELGYESERVVAAGNSGNDSKLFEHGFHGIIVANADDELKHYAKHVKNYLSSQGIADGVRDGLEYWMPRLTKHHA